MDNALAATAPQTLIPEPRTLSEKLAALPLKPLVLLGLGAAALAAVAIALALRSGGESNYRVLYSGLSDKDGGAVIAQLSQMNVPYRHSDGGGAILVPADKVLDLRMKLSNLGLPKSSTVGYELLDNQKFGQTQAGEGMSMKRATEGELMRTIGSLSAVQQVRVHLALPAQNGFFREQQKPSASVVLTLHAGRTLESAQVAGIVHLISSSVPEMNPKAVSVLDQTGTLISSAPDSNPQAGLDAQQLQYVAQIEQGYAKRIAELLEPVVGRENLRANVTADVDFSQIESTEEAFKPNQGPDAGPATVRSQQTTEQNGSNAPGASGVPGAASNQPPVAAAAPLSAASGSAASNATTMGANSRRDAVTNFEVDKTVRVTRNATGSIKRLNAAVVVNNRSVTDPKGKTTQVPLAPEELDKLTALVQESIGFNKERGDSVKVVNAPFKVGPVPEEVSVPLWKQPEVIDMLRALAVPAGLSLVAMMIFFGMIRPALNAALAPPVPEPGSNIDASVGGDEALPGLPPPSAAAIRALEGPMSSGDLDAARNLAMQNPAAVAQIVRGWVNGQPA